MAKAVLCMYTIMDMQTDPHGIFLQLEISYQHFAILKYVHRK